MAILGVLLGIALCAIAWCIESIRENNRLISLQRRINDELEDRLLAQERRKPQATPEPTTEQAKPKRANMRRWNEDVGAAGEAQ